MMKKICMLLFLGTVLAVSCSKDKDEEVIVTQNSEKELTSFGFLAASNETLSVDVTGDILPDNIVEVEVPFGTPLTALVPTIGFTAGAAIDPQAAETDFGGDVVYTITAADGSTAEYTVKVTVAGSGEKQLTSFKFLAASNETLSVDVTGDILPDNTVEVGVPFGTPLTALVPTIGFTAGATIDPQAAETDFSGDVVYTITAADGSTAEYTVKVIVAGSGEKQLTSFKFLAVSNEALSVDVTGNIDEDKKEVGIEVPFGTPLTALVPTIGFTAGATIDPQAAETDFSGDVAYTITAADGSTAQYTVKVSVAAGSSEKQLTSFKFLASDNDGALSVDVTGNIDEATRTVLAEVPFGTSLTALVPTIGFTAGATIDPQAAETDFSGDVGYTITAADGSTAEYTVKVTVAAGSSEKQLTSFKFLAASNEALSVDVIGNILPDNIVEVEVPFGTPLTALVPTIGFTAGAAIDPQAAETDFSGDVAYTITAEDGSTAGYTVKVAVAQNSEKQMTSFKFLASDNEGALDVDVTGDILPDNTVEVEVPFGTPLTALVPTIGFTEGATIDPQAAETDFSGDVVYTITAADGSTAGYTVKVSEQAPTDRQVLEDIFRSNPGNTIGDSWQVDEPDSDIGTWEGVVVDADGRVTFLSLINMRISVLPVSIGNLAQLTDLNLRGNNLTSIPSEIGNLAQLTSLSLNTNDLTSVPAEIGNLAQLTSLSLDNNSLTSLPAEIGNLVQLTELNLIENNLTSLPAEIGNLAQLRFLYLSINSLTSLPAEIGNLAQLTGLSLFSNDLTSIPSEIGNLAQLTELRVEDNSLTSVPAEIGNLIQLTILRLNGNDLTAIPQAVCDLATEHGTAIIKDAGVACQ